MILSKDAHNVEIHEYYLLYVTLFAQPHATKDHQSLATRLFSQYLSHSISEKNYSKISQSTSNSTLLEAPAANQIDIPTSMIYINRLAHDSRLFHHKD